MIKLLFKLAYLLLKPNKKTFISRAILRAIKKYVQKKTGMTVYDINFRGKELTLTSRFEQCKVFVEFFRKYKHCDKVSTWMSLNDAYYTCASFKEMME